MKLLGGGVSLQWFTTYGRRFISQKTRDFFPTSISGGGGFLTHLKHISQIGSFQQIGENKTCLKPPPESFGVFQTRIHEQNIREKTSSAVLSRTLYEQKNGRKPTWTVLEFGRRKWRLERRIGHDSILYNPFWFRRGGKCIVTSWKNPFVVSKTNFDKQKMGTKACFKKTPAKDFVNAFSLGCVIISTIAVRRGQGPSNQHSLVRELSKYRLDHWA